MENTFQIGIISSTHGVKGEAKIFPTTDEVKRFKSLKEVILDTGNGTIILEIEGVKFFKQFAILKFKGIDRIEDIEVYKGKSLLVARENAIKLKKDEYFIADLVGIAVENEDNTFKGRLIEIIETGANDVYVIKTEDGKEILIPAIKECILKVDIEENKMLVHLLEGLLSLNESVKSNSKA